MSMEWRLPDPKEREYDKLPSVWISVAIVVVVYTAAFVLTVLTWDKGKPVNSGGFFVRVLVIPLLGSIALGAYLYMDRERARHCVDIWNYLCRRMRACWQAWAQGRVAILGSVTLTPERDLAERMLGLEGTAPRNEGKILPLVSNDGEGASEDGGETVLVATRFEDVLEKLVTPFVDCMASFAARHTFGILIHADHEDPLSAMRTLLRKLDLANADRIGVTRMEAVPDASLIHHWLAEGKMPDFCLVVACQLHRQDQEPRYSEAAASMLFASAGVTGRYRDRLKPQAYVSQPISAATDEVATALRDMLTARQTPSQGVRHLWLTSMPRQARHAAIAAASDAGLKVTVHDVDLAIGKPGPANALLVQALAAEMVQHGQGTQLVATEGGAGVMLSLTGTQLVPAYPVTPVGPSYLSISGTLLAISVSVLGVIFLSFGDSSESWYWGVGAYFVAIMLIQVFNGWIGYRSVHDEFYGRSS
jgi:hypothetical protein